MPLIIGGIAGEIKVARLSEKIQPAPIKFSEQRTIVSSVVVRYPNCLRMPARLTLSAERLSLRGGSSSRTGCSAAKHLPQCSSIVLTGKRRTMQWSFPEPLSRPSVVWLLRSSKWTQTKNRAYGHPGDGVSTSSFGRGHIKADFAIFKFLIYGSNLRDCVRRFSGRDIDVHLCCHYRSYPNA